MTRSTINPGNVDIVTSGVDCYTIISCDLKVKWYLCHFWYFIIYERTIFHEKWKMHKHQKSKIINKLYIYIYVPVWIVESNMLTLAESLISIPSVLGLSSGAIRFIFDIATFLHSWIDIWFFGLLIEVILLILKLSHWLICNACTHTQTQKTLYK